MSKRLILPVSMALNLLLLAALLIPLRFTGAQSADRYFPETHHWVRGQFAQYWQDHGGLGQQGYPLTEEFQEKNKLNGQTYTVQYFERAIFEKHPENKPPYDVLLSQLGKFELDSRYPNNSNPAAAPVPGPGGGGQPTVAPAPTQPPAPGGQINLIQETHYTDSVGGLTFVGLAKNNTGHPLQRLEGALTLLGADNGTLATGDMSDYGSGYIPDGALIPFLVDVSHPPTQWGSERWQFVSDVYDPASFTGQEVYKDLVIESVALQAPTNAYEDWSLVGTIKNTGSKTAQFVEAHVAVYDAGGKLIDANYDFASLDTLPPGGTTPFKTTFRRASSAKLTPVKQDILLTALVK